MLSRELNNMTMLLKTSLLTLKKICQALIFPISFGKLAFLVQDYSGSDEKREHACVACVEDSPAAEST